MKDQTLLPLKCPNCNSRNIRVIEETKGKQKWSCSFCRREFDKILKKKKSSK